jgi:hypothetical protein
MKMKSNKIKNLKLESNYISDQQRLSSHTGDSFEAKQFLKGESKPIFKNMARVNPVKALKDPNA